MRKIKYLYAVHNSGYIPMYRVRVIKQSDDSFVILGIIPRVVKRSRMVRKNTSYFYSERAALEFDEDILYARIERMQRKQGCDK